MATLVDELAEEMAENERLGRGGQAGAGAGSDMRSDDRAFAYGSAG